MDPIEKVLQSFLDGEGSLRRSRGFDIRRSVISGNLESGSFVVETTAFSRPLTPTELGTALYSTITATPFPEEAYWLAARFRTREQMVSGSPSFSPSSSVVRLDSVSLAVRDVPVGFAFLEYLLKQADSSFTVVPRTPDAQAALTRLRTVYPYEVDLEQAGGGLVGHVTYDPLYTAPSTGRS